MMKRFLLSTLLSSVLYVAICAQPVISPASFPQPGDLLYFAVDSFPNIPLGDPSSDYQEWDFSNTIVIEEWLIQEITDAANGNVTDSFPSANIIVPFFSGDGYTEIYQDSIEILGFSGSPTPGLADLDLFIRMEPPLTSQRANFTYGATFFDTGGFDITVDADEIPPSPDLPDLTLADSIRVVFTIAKEDTVDAWGQLTTAYGTFDVLRVKETEYRYTGAFAKVGFWGWWDLNTFDIPGLGHDTLIYYNFISSDSKEPICRILTGENEFGLTFEIAWMKVDEDFISMTVSTEDPVADQRELTAFPNPATTSLNIRVNGFPNGDYSLNVYNVLGKLVESRPIQLNGLLEEQIDLFRYPQGTYLYSIFDENGTNLQTKRFFVHRP